MWGTAAPQELQFKAEDLHLVWGNRKVSRKKLCLALDVSKLPNVRWQHLADSQVLRSGIIREEVRGQMRYFALLSVKGHPYRNPDYLRQVLEGPQDVLGLDLGVSQIALIGEEYSEILPLCDAKYIDERKADTAKERRTKRALQRSRQANNPDAFYKDGRSKKGVRQNNKSNRGRKLEFTVKRTGKRP